MTTAVGALAPSATPHCAHCGLLVPRSLRKAEGPSFCCSGCETVYHLIQQHGLGEYYTLRDVLPQGPADLALAEQAYREYDDPHFLDKNADALEGGQLQVQLYVEGVHCSACLWLIEKAMLQIDGVQEARLHFGLSRLSLRFSPAEVRLSQIAVRLSHLGYRPHPVRLAKDGHQRAARCMLIRIGVAAAVAGNVMLMAFALYGGEYSGMEASHRSLFRWLSLAASLPAVLYSAWPFYRSAVAGLLNRVFHMDLPISLGILAGFVSGVVNTVRGEGEIYFDSVTALIFLLLVGRMLQLRQQRAVTESSQMLHALTPAWARRIRKGEAERIALDAIDTDDLLEVRAQECFPADGILVRGRSSVDASLLSGESLPTPLQADDEVFAGTTNLEDTVLIRAKGPVSESRVAKLSELVEKAATTRSPVVQLADRVAGWFVAVVLLLAGLTVLSWSLIDPAVAIDHGVALLVVSCPCALGLATPLAMTAAIGRAARNGILVRSGAALEALSRPGTILFDKTGTLTHGRLEVSTVRAPDGSALAPKALSALLPLLDAAERSSQHPIAKALRRFCRSQQTFLALEVVQTEVVVGSGVQAQVKTPDGVRTVRVGSPQWVHPDAPSLEHLSSVSIAVDGIPQALLGLTDELRAEARASVDALLKRGFQVGIVSGDNQAVVSAVGERLGLPPEACVGNTSPEGKLAYLRALEGPVIMVGDGVNDAAALAAATVGVAVHGGAEVALAAADVYLSKSGIEPVLHLVKGAKKTTAVLRSNVLFSLSYNAFGASLAAFGFLSPLVAALLMPISSLVVVTHSFRSAFRVRG